MHGRSVVLDRVSVDSSSMTSSPQSRPTLILRAGALAGGYTDGEIRRLHDRGIATAQAGGTASDIPGDLAPSHRRRSGGQSCLGGSPTRLAVMAGAPRPGPRDSTASSDEPPGIPVTRPRSGARC